MKQNFNNVGANSNTDLNMNSKFEIAQDMQISLAAYSRA